jgi:acetyl-CoA carboxylase biotin carboxylase subunit
VPGLRKVLVANRGEIAVRVIRACHELGLHAVAVYSDVDRPALHVRHADEAYYLGPAPATDSYLRGARLIEIAKACGADAIHPGYGFLAENAGFARAVDEAGLVFVGPPGEAIALMGDKIAARTAFRKAGAPIVPGTEHAVTDEEALAEAPRVGFPLLIKAAAGGGGKGLRRVEDLSQVEAALASSRREATKAFGNDAVYLERLLEGARHIEIQVLADATGNVVHLGERECSMQRRHQKVLEESPSPAVDEPLRQAMGEAAVSAVRKLGYVSAGTVEFLLDRDGRYYFLEMNTRLQVEHPVTELITGIDLVKQMLRIAGGRPMRIRQEDVEWRGHAIECRINAEDPYSNFVPSTGRITALAEPTGPGVRVDSALYEGAEISLFYDSLLAKVITWGESRADAILRMRRALEEFRIVGVKTTIPLHQRIVDTTQFIGGNYDNRYLEESFAMAPDDGARLDHVAAIVATMIAHQRRGAAINRLAPAGGRSAWKLAGRRTVLRS